MSDVQNVVTVTLPGRTSDTTRIALNGHNIQSGGVFGRSGSMRSFKLVDNILVDIYPYWDRQLPLEIHDEQGKKSLIRIYALPVGSKGTGFVEFV